MSVRPDLKYIASKVVTRKAIDFLEGLIKPPSDQPQAQPQGAEQAPPESEGEGDLLGTLLERALKKNHPSSDVPSQ